MLFTEGLTEPLKGWVKAYRPPTLQDAILRTRDLEDSVPKTKNFSKPFVPQRDRYRNPFHREWKGKEKLDDETRRELMRKKLFFSRRDPWVPGQRCMGKGEIHYIEVETDRVDIEEEEQDCGSTSSKEELALVEEQPPRRSPTPAGAHPPVVPQPLEQANRRKPTKGGVIATLSGVPRYDTLRIRGIIQGQQTITLIDGGATHNFIDASLVSRRALQTEEFEGFDVVVADGHTVECLDIVPNLDMKLGKYTVRDTFYVVDLLDTDVVLGVQWMITMGKITTNYQTLEMGFRDQNGKKVVLRGVSTGEPRTVSTKRMERIFRHGEVAYVIECLITTQKDSKGRQQYHTKIKNLLGRHQQVFEAIPPGRPPDRRFEHTIELEEGAKPMITPPYRHSRRFKDEIEKAIKELLAMGRIRLSSSPFSSSIVLVLKKDGTMRMCIDY
jgi:hypothetical protein